MKPVCHRQIAGPTARMHFKAFVLGIAIPVAALRAAPGDQLVAEDLFDGATVPRIVIDIPEDGVEILRGARNTRTPRAKPKAQATVTEGSRVYTNVSVQLKGYTSFQPIDRLPALTLNFHKFAPGQKFHGLCKISLNNSIQDPTRLNEKLAREVFASAGVPTPRADHALVTLNGRDLGLYVVTEGFDQAFLQRHFALGDGNLYEAGVLQDIDRPLEVDSGRYPTNRAGVEKLLAATRETDPKKRYAKLEAALDMDRFLSMVAIETILCHSDSYSMNRNNYRLYHDPATDKMVFLPHGMDRVLGMHRSSLDLPLVPPTLGIVAWAVLSTTEGRLRYVERAGLLVTNVFDPARLCRRVRAIDERILAAKLDSPAPHAFGGKQTRNHAQDANSLCDRIDTRCASLKSQLTDVREWLVPSPIPDFNQHGVARLNHWRLDSRFPQPTVTCESTNRNGKEVLCLRSAERPFTAQLRARVALPAGTYLVVGQMQVEGAIVTDVWPSITRYSSERFGVQRQRLDGRRLNSTIEISESRAPEEIEFTCEVRGDLKQVWFDASSMHLVRRKR